MDAEAPFLEDREEGRRTRIVALLSRLLAPVTLDPWRTLLDGIVLLLLTVNIVLSILITADSTSSSPCKTLDAPVTMKVATLLLPPCLISAVLYASYLARYAAGAPQRAALALFQMVLGVMLAEWLAICACGVSAGPVLTVGSVVVAVLVGGLHQQLYWWQLDGR